MTLYGEIDRRLNQCRGRNASLVAERDRLLDEVAKVRAENARLLTELEAVRAGLRCSAGEYPVPDLCMPSRECANTAEAEERSEAKCGNS